MGDKTKEFVIDNQSPYCLHPSDESGAIITTLTFVGKNYELWEKVVLIVLTIKSKVAFIDGIISKQEMQKVAYSAEANTWIIMNSMVTSWIQNVIDPRLHTSIAYTDSAQAIWEHIQKRYAVPNVPKIH